MGWFWAETSLTALPPPPSGHPPVSPGREPPSGCPMHKKTADALSPKKTSDLTTTGAGASACPVPHGQPASGCPVPHDRRSASEPASACPVPHDQRTESKPQSMLSQLNPLNYMFPDLSQKPAENQSVVLPTSREESTIPKGDGDGNWEYPSPQQMYNALLRKGYSDTDVTAVESMVTVHNFLNEGAWQEIVDWERRFGRGLYRGWQICKRGEEHVDEELERHWDGKDAEPTLIRFQGRPKDMTPRATMLQVLGWVYPAKFGTEPPFDRHDWFVSRHVNGEQKQIRYVIDYYSGDPEPSGEPVFYLDVRPAATPLGIAERTIRWGSDVWWKAIGGDKREQDPQSLFGSK